MLNQPIIFAFIVGSLTGLVIKGARVWARDWGLKMTWWKWSLAAIWYLLLNFFILLAFTLIGEGEPTAGFRLILFFGILLIILAVGLIRILWAGRGK